jgi:hypothetical protein
VVRYEELMDESAVIGGGNGGVSVSEGHRRYKLCLLVVSYYCCGSIAY